MPAVFNTTKCRLCPARIVLATTPVSRRLAIDADPHPDGMLALEWFGEVLHVRVVPKVTREVIRTRDGGLYRAHAHQVT